MTHHFRSVGHPDAPRRRGPPPGRVSDATEEAAQRMHYCRALRHAERAQRARGVVTLLLALGVLTTAASAKG